MNKTAFKNFNEFVEFLRNFRGFDENEYLQSKKKAINEFFKIQNLDSAVIGISGGIDSAVVYKLLLESSKMPNSPIKKIVPVIAPIECRGTTGQGLASIKANLLLSGEHDSLYCELRDSFNAIVHQISLSDNALFKSDAWAEGQMASVLRTPLFYYVAALLQTKGYKSIVVGTTNRDEGSYIGFFGKASDAMVDLQPIGDIHKSEVYKIANLLKIPSEIIDATPRGDVWDGKNDEQMIGAPYDAVEAFLLLKQYRISTDSIIIEDSNEYKMFLEHVKNIETIHQKNAHKYQVGYPSHFIDIMPRKIEGGW